MKETLRATTATRLHLHTILIRYFSSRRDFMELCRKLLARCMLEEQPISEDWNSQRYGEVGFELGTEDVVSTSDPAWVTMGNPWASSNPCC